MTNRPRCLNRRLRKSWTIIRLFNDACWGLVVLMLYFSSCGQMAWGAEEASASVVPEKPAPRLVVQTGHSAGVKAVAFSPNGSTLASASQDKSIKLWDLASGKELRTLTGHGKEVYSVVFSPDGRMLVSGSGDETVKLWDVATGREVHERRL